MICQNTHALTYGPEGYSNVGPCKRKATRSRWTEKLNLKTLKHERVLRHYCTQCAGVYDDVQAERRWEAKVS